MFSSCSFFSTIILDDQVAANVAPAQPQQQQQQQQTAQAETKSNIASQVQNLDGAYTRPLVTTGKIHGFLKPDYYGRLDSYGLNGNAAVT